MRNEKRFFLLTALLKALWNRPTWRAGVLGAMMAAGVLLAFTRRRVYIRPVPALPIGQPADSHALTSQPAQQGFSARFTLALTCLLLMAAAFYFRVWDQPDALTAGLLFTGCAFLLFAPLPLPACPLDAAPNLTRFARRGVWLILAGSGLLLALTFINVSYVQIESLRQITVHAQMALFAAGVGLTLWGMCGAPARRVRLRWRVGLLAGILLLALVLRVWDLENSIHIFMDEMHFVNAINALRDSQTPDSAAVMILHPFDGLAAFPYHFPYMQHIGVQLLGSNLTPLRLPSVFFGVLNVLALYLLAQALFGRKTALLAAFLLAVFPPHVHFSRLGLNNSADAALGTLALAFTARAIKFGRMREYVLAGGALGLSQYFYEGGRLLFPALLAVWLLVLWRKLPHTHWRGPAALVFAAVLIAFPYYYTQIGLHYDLAPRLAQVGHRADYTERIFSTFTSEGFANYLNYNLLPPILHLFYKPDGSAFFYGGETALTLPFMLPLLLLGFFHALRGWQRPAYGLLLLWLALTVLGNSLLQFSDWSARFVVVFPALALLMALGAQRILTEFTAVGRGLGTRLALILLLAAGVGQVAYYFGPHLALFNRQIRPPCDFHDMMFRVRDLPQVSEVYILSNTIIYWPQIESLKRFWSLDVEFGQWERGPALAAHLAAQRSDTTRAFFVQPADSQVMRLVRELFHLSEPQFSPYNVPRDMQFLLYVSTQVRAR